MNLTGHRFLISVKEDMFRAAHIVDLLENGSEESCTIMRKSTKRLWKKSGIIVHFDFRGETFQKNIT